MALLTPLGLLMFLLQQGLRGFQEIRYVVIGLSVLQLTVKAVLTVALLVLGFGLLGYATAVVLSTSVATIWMVVGLWRTKTPLDCRETSNLPLRTMPRPGGPMRRLCIATRYWG